jgi:hypothetical protein
VNDPSGLKSAGSHNYHPLFRTTHTAMAVTLVRLRTAPAIDEEDRAERGRGERGAHARILISTSPTRPRQADRPVPGQRDGLPFSRVSGARFGAHQFCERMSGTIVHAVWFSGGLLIIDVADPLVPREIGHFIPEPVTGRRAPQSNDVALDERGLIYLVDRNVGFDILVYTGTA